MKFFLMIGVLVLLSGLSVAAYDPNIADASFGNPLLTSVDDDGLDGDTGDLGDGAFDGLTNEASVHL